MRIRLEGRETELDLVTEVLCVIASVSNVSTYPDDEDPLHLRRYVQLTWCLDALLDMGLLTENAIRAVD